MSIANSANAKKEDVDYKAALIFPANCKLWT